MFRRIAIINRGEAAMRLIHAVRDLNAESGQEPITTIALYTDAEVPVPGPPPSFRRTSPSTR